MNSLPRLRPGQGDWAETIRRPHKTISGTVMERVNAAETYELARAFILSADAVRLRQQIGWPIEESRARAHIDARDRLSEMLPEKHPVKWYYKGVRRHVPALVKHSGMPPFQDKWSAVCSCTHYQSGRGTRGEALKNGWDHVKSMVRV